jgi:cobalamin biosynthesis Mg chelatase CobN
VGLRRVCEEETETGVRNESAEERQESAPMNNYYSGYGLAELAAAKAKKKKPAKESAPPVFYEAPSAFSKSSVYWVAGIGLVAVLGIVGIGWFRGRRKKGS